MTHKNEAGCPPGALKTINSARAYTGHRKAARRDPRARGTLPYMAVVWLGKLCRDLVNAKGSMFLANRYVPKRPTKELDSLVSSLRSALLQVEAHLTAADNAAQRIRALMTRYQERHGAVRPD